MIEKIKQAGDDNNVLAVVLTSLSKAFNCVNHELLIAKLSAYCFDSLSCEFLSAYFNFRKQKTKVGSTFRSLCVYSVWYSLRFYSWATFFQCLHFIYLSIYSVI